MTDASRPDVAAIVADALAISARYEWGPSWPDKAEQWGAALVGIDHRLAALGVCRWRDRAADAPRALESSRARGRHSCHR